MSPQLRQIWKNEYFKTVLALVLTVLVVLGFFQGLKWVLRTDYPVLAVVSTSMVPTLNVGDLLVVQGIAAKDINATYGTGDILIFAPDKGRPDYRIVHRAIGRIVENGQIKFITQGDNNGGPGPYSPTPAEDVIGKVVMRIPYLGNLSLLTQSQGSVYPFFMIAIVLIIILLIFWNTGSENEKGGEEPKKKKKLFGKLSYEAVIFTVINVLLICFIIFNLWGAFTFWQPGADPPQYVTIRGMCTDRQYHFIDPNIESHNNISGAFLLQGFFTYKIDGLANGAPRSGVLTFSWFQFSIFLLIVFDIWELVSHFRANVSAKTSELELSQARSPK
jgi:signal peptidase I